MSIEGRRGDDWFGIVEVLYRMVVHKVIRLRTFRAFTLDE